MENQLINKAYCLAIFDLAANATHNQIQRLNTAERLAVSQIANSILKDRDLPYIDLKMMIKIKSKLKETQLETKKKNSTKIANFFQRLLNIRPSSKEIENKIKKVKNFIESNLPEIKGKIEEKSVKLDALKARIKDRDSCLAEYKEIVESYTLSKEETELKEVPGQVEAYLKQKSKFHAKLQKQLKNTANVIRNVRAMLKEEETEMKHRFYSDIEVINAKQAEIKEKNVDEISINKENQKMGKYLSKRLKDEENQLDKIKETLKLDETELDHLEFIAEISHTHDSLDSIANKLTSQLDNLTAQISQMDENDPARPLVAQREQLDAILKILKDNR